MMNHLILKLSMITMIITALILSMGFVNEKSTPDRSDDEAFSIESTGETGIVLAANKEADNNIVSFNWIEKGFDGQLDHIEFQLGTEKDEILSKRGNAIETGYYEGGEYFRYDDATFFINPDTDRLVAIALSIEEYDLNGTKLKKILGTPDVSERNEMEGLWMYEYYLDKYTLMFEADNENGKILFAWLRERV
ncbi:hypothetical protein [Alkalihalobacillus sp. BA299]|uniref:hypothetical protein n=1 Tax=Alkalihalobacillus sp. BA299 TaxID=2815938 RepID=UPI001ADBCEA8|nr:hypothetical protein [Alkalihalobacillus sp. BA299]